MIAPRFLPVVMAPQPPMEWKRTATAPSGSSEGVSVADDGVGVVDAEDEEADAVRGASCRPCGRGRRWRIHTRR